MGRVRACPQAAQVNVCWSMPDIVARERRVGDWILRLVDHRAAVAAFLVANTSVANGAVAARVLSSAIGHECAQVLSVVVADALPIARCMVTTSQPVRLVAERVARWLDCSVDSRRGGDSRG